MRWLTHRTLVLALPFAVACGVRERSSAVSDGAQTSDSAGVPVVTNPAPEPSAPTFKLSAQPLVSIGVAEGAPAYQLFRANQAAVLSDGTIVVSNRGTQELRFYDKTGKYSSGGGKQGQGPGEFDMNGAELVGTFSGDSVVMEDRGLRRFSVFDKTGKFGRSFQFPPELGVFPSPGGVLADGRIVALDNFIGPGHGFGERNGRLRLPVKVFVVSPDGSSVDTLGEFPGLEASVGPFESGPVYFGRGLFVTASGNRVAIGNNDAYSVRIYDEAERLVRVVRQERKPVPVKDGDFESMIPGPLKAGSSASATKLLARFEALTEQMYRYTTLPAFGGDSPSAMRFDNAGNLWVEEYRMHRADPDSWQSFSPAGVFLGRLDLPAKITLLDIGTDYVLLKVIDELDVEHVVLYGLERSGEIAE